ncbi:MAG: hypothetical protein QM572_01015 [Nocardioides sp.]|uniref:hypothetical protein n=1 Tax=Nocardioides sp. TaxID=35761 RepID=UPI0039E51844
MRRIMTPIASALVVASCLLAVGDQPAHATTTCQKTDPATGACQISVETPDAPTSPGEANGDKPTDTGSGASCYWDGTAQAISKPAPGPVPCTSDAGYWSNDYECYIAPVDPQPPAGDPSWKGHQPGDGAVYNCYQPQTGSLVMLWGQDPPANSGAGPTPRDVAELAIKQMDLRAIDIGITPEPSTNSIGLVGMPIWLWDVGPDAHTFGPATASATAGGITITATAKVNKITWDMGDGSTVNCTTAGTPYKASYGNKKSPDCGYVYMKSSSHEPGGKYTVTATSDWVITWEGAGQNGVIRLNGLSRSVQIAVGEAQVLVR